uniref:VWFA domain-containing protein n=1 Tax=Arcella intermedia TaxID=1963864 RepID=A0A6B2L9G1_9EUKA
MVFCVDCTGSMGSYIQTAKDNITSIVESIVASESASIGFALVMYRDHPPQDSSFVTKVCDFTTDLSLMKEYVDSMAASGGGDTPEAMGSGLVACLSLSYRPTSTKVCILIADAPPHGISASPSGDGFPNGDPGCADLLSISRSFAEQSIRLYAVGCEPAISSHTEAMSWMRWTADLTGGRYISLKRAAHLSAIIVGGCRVELNHDKLAVEVEAELAKLRAQGYTISDQESKKKVASMIARSLHERKITTVDLLFNDIPDPAHFKYYNVFSDATDVAHFKTLIGGNFVPYEEPKLKAGITEQSEVVQVKTVTITEEHILKIFQLKPSL